MRVLRHVAPWGMAFALLACDDATNITTTKADVGGGGGGSFGGAQTTPDIGTGGGAGHGGAGGQVPDTDALPGADARLPLPDANIVPKPDGQMPPPPDARVSPPDPDGAIARRDAFVPPPDPDGAIARQDAFVPPPADAAVGPGADAAVIVLDPDAGVVQPGQLRLTRARIVWTAGPLGTGASIGSTAVSRNGFLRLTGRVLFATGGQMP